MHVDLIDIGYTQEDDSYITLTDVTIVNKYDEPVSDATVYQLTTFPNRSPVSAARRTNRNGSVTFGIRSKQIGIYTSDVENVTHALLVYNSADNKKNSDTHRVP